MDIVARVSEFQTIPPPLMHRVHRLQGLHRKSFAVEGPLVETVERAVVLDDRHLDRLVGGDGRAIRLAKLRVIPAERFWLDPLRLALLRRVFDDNPHPMSPVVIRQIAHHQYAGMLHFDECRDAFSGPQPEHWYVRLCWHGIAVERDNPKEMPRQGEAADLGRARIEHMEHHAFARLHADRLTVPEHPTIDAKQLVAHFETLGLLLRFLVGGPPDLLQRLDGSTGEHVHCQITPAAEGWRELLHDQKNLAVIGAEVALRFDIDGPGLARKCRGSGRLRPRHAYGRIGSPRASERTRSGAFRAPARTANLPRKRRRRRWGSSARASAPAPACR